MKKYQKQLLKGMVTFIVVVSIVLSTGVFVSKAADCTISITADKSSVNVGETFNVTVSVSGPDVGVVKGNLTISGGASTGDTLVYLYKTYTSATYSFQATSAGTVTISMDVSNALFFTSETEMTCDVGSCSVSVVEPTTAAPTTEAPTTAAPTTEAPTTAAPTTEAPTTQAPTTEAPTTQAPTTVAPTTAAPTTAAPTTEARSNNAYLEALSIYPGTLSPAFDSKTYIYEVTVKNDVTKLSVSAATADVEATYIITDTNLEVGRNVIDIKVTAADGTVLWYAIRVTRQSAETTTADTTERETSTERTTEETTTTAEESSSEANPLEVVVGSTTAYVQETLGNVEIPEGFEELNYQFRGVEIEALKGLGNSLLLLPVADETGTKLYIYNEENGGLYPYVGIQITSALYTVLPFDSEEQIPDGYKLTVVEFDGSLIDTWVRTDAENNNFVLFYAMNWEGTTGLYRYDAEENTLQRVNKDEVAAAATEAESQPTEESSQVENTTASGSKVDDQYLAHYEETLKKINRRDTIMFVIMIILLLCLIVMYLLFASGKKDDPDDEPNDDSDDDSDDDTDEEFDNDSEDDFDTALSDEVFEDADELADEDSDGEASGVDGAEAEDNAELDDAEAFQKELEQIQLGMAGILADFDVDSDEEAEAETEAEAVAETEAEAEAVAEVEAEAEAEAVAEVEAEAEAETMTEAQTETEAEPETGAETEVKADLEAELELDVENLELELEDVTELQADAEDAALTGTADELELEDLEFDDLELEDLDL